MTEIASRPLNIAMIGCGRISLSHLDAIAARPLDAQVVAVVDRDLDLARKAAERFGAPAFATLEEVLAIAHVDAVLLATPNHLHAAQAMAALKAGKHVLVEKPAAETGEDA
ncbi:MAG: Gfo/Idh/MocA family oxidoreductase, partial [Novosphingobium sp.]